MANTTFNLPIPPLKAVDNGDGTYSVAISVLAGLGALGAAAWVIGNDAEADMKSYAEKLQAAGYPVWVCSSADDNVDIQAAIAYVAASGTRGTVSLFGTFECSATINAVSNVDVQGNNCTINVTINGVGDALSFNNITNSIWENINVYRDGNVGANSLIAALHVTGNDTDETCIFRRCNFVNRTDTTVVGEGLLVGIWVGHLSAPSPVFYDVIGQGSANATAGYLHVGIDVHILYDPVTGALGRPKFYNCTGIGGAGGGPTTLSSPGWDITEANGAEFYYCVGIATSGRDGFLINDCSPLLVNTKGIAGPIADGAGIRTWVGGSPRLINCEGVSGTSVAGSYALLIDQQSAAIVDGFWGHPPMDGYQWYYDDANNGRFRPFDGTDWYIYSISIWVHAAQAPGVTIDIGTTPGGSQIANNIPIDVADGLTFIWIPYYVAAGAYLYVTPSVPIPDGAVYIYYTPIYAVSASASLLMRTSEEAVVTNSHFLGCASNGFGPALLITANGITYENWRVENCVLESIASTTVSCIPVYSSGAISEIPVYNSIIRGRGWYTIFNTGQTNVSSYANESGNVFIGRNANVDARWINPGEIRTASGPLIAGNANAIGFAWHAPVAEDILIKKVVIEVTTGGGVGGSHLDVGIADNAAGLNRGVEFFDDLLLNVVQIDDSWVGGDGGTQTKWVICQDSQSATDAWIVGEILDANAASLVGKFYIEYVGR